MTQGPIYLDYNATTPLDPAVLQAMLPHLTNPIGNASSAHSLGRATRAAVERARRQVAELIGAKPEEIVFTSGATESNNIAILGVVRALGRPGHIVSSSIEHKAILDACRQAQREGHAYTWVRPGSDGRVAPQEVSKALRDDTAVVSFMLGNNEIGAINPIADLARLARARGALVHCDGTQGIGQVPFNVRDLDVDLASFSSHKICGPMGIGALYVREGVLPKLAPLSFGGGQEAGLRSGTLNVPAIVGFGEACRIARERMQEDSQRIAALRDRLLATFERELTGLTLNGSREQRLPGNLNIAFGFVDAKVLLQSLDGKLCASLGSACTSTNPEPSHVLRGIGAGNDRARASVRFCVGRFTTEAEVDAAARMVIAAVREQRERSPLWQASKAA